jgi:capsular polysaccharide biosynthesis protein
MSEHAIAPPETAVMAEPGEAREPDREPDPEPPFLREPEPQRARDPEPEPLTPPRERSQPSFVGPLEAMLRHPFLTLLPILLAAGAAVYFGIERDPVYTAEARINVGRADVPAYSLQNVVIGNSTLAAGYARAIDAPDVLERADEETGIGTREARERLQASPIPGSTLIRVEAEGPSEQAAVDLANAGSESLVAYLTELNEAQEPDDVLDDFRRVRSRVERLERRLRSLRRAESPNASRIRRAELDLEVATLQAATLNEQYRGARANTIEGLLQVIAPADAADSDESSFLQRLILLAAAAGLLVGMTLALLRANARVIGRRRR